MKLGTSSVRFIIFFCIVISSTLSCSKKESTSALTIDLSSLNSGFFVGTLKGVIVQLRNAEKGKNLAYMYDCEKGTLSGSPLGIGETLDVDCGSVGEVSLSLKNMTGQTLLQFALIYDDTNNDTQVYYGDDIRSWVIGDNDITMSVVDLFDSAKEGKIAGRYIPSAGYPGAGRYLTGYMEMSLDVASHPQVDDTRPPLKLPGMQSEIFGGWTEVFSSDQFGFRYKFYGLDEVGNSYNGVEIFTDLYGTTGLNLNSPGLQPNASYIAHYDLPGPYYDQRDGVYQQRTFEKRIVGIFGANPDGHYLCANSFSGSLNGINGVSEVCKTAGVDVDGNSVCTTYYSWSEVMSAAGTSAPATLDGSTNSCLAAANEHAIDLEDIGHGDGDFAGFYGPFEDNSLYDQDIFHVDASTPGSEFLAWTMADNANVDEVDVFFSADVSTFDKRNIEESGGNYNCERLPDYGFSFLGTVAVTPGSESTISLAGQALSTNSGVAICPIRHDANQANKRRYYGSAIVVDKHYNNGGSSPQLIELALYDSTFAQMPNWDFAGNNWNSGMPAILPGVMPGSGVGELYVVVHNTSNQTVNISPQMGSGMDGFTIQLAPASTPTGYIDCAALTNSMQLDASGGAEDACAFRVELSASASIYAGSPFTAHSRVHINATPSSDPTAYGGTEFPIVGGAYETFFNGGSLYTTDIYAPPGKVDVKYIKFYNDDASPWFLSHFTSGSDLGGGTNTFYHHNCPASLNNTDSCDVWLVADNRAGTVSDNTAVFSAFGPGSISGMWDATFYSAPLNLSEGDPYDFGPAQITGNVSHAFTITNDSAQSFYAYSMGISDNNSSGSNIVADEPMGATFCGSPQTVGNAALCDFNITISYVSGFGYNEEFVSLKHSFGTTYREFVFRVISDHQ